MSKQICLGGKMVAEDGVGEQFCQQMVQLIVYRDGKVIAICLMHHNMNTDVIIKDLSKGEI